MSRHVTIAAILCGTGIVAGTLLLVRPTDRQTLRTYEDVADLTPLIATAPVHNTRLHDLGFALDELGTYVGKVCATDAAVADVEDLLAFIRPADDAPGVRRHDLRSGSPRDARDGRILPFTIDIEGTFDSVFECLRRAETTSRPVRVTAVEMDVLDDDTRDRAPMLAASIDLEIVVDATTGEASQ